MEVHNIKNFTKWWFIGNFEPSLLKTKDFEVAIKHYKAWDQEEAHYHKEAIEYTVIISWKFKMNDTLLQKNDIIVMNKNEVSNFECIKDWTTVVVKSPSLHWDKFII